MELSTNLYLLYHFICILSHYIACFQFNIPIFYIYFILRNIDFIPVIVRYLPTSNALLPVAYHGFSWISRACVIMIIRYCCQPRYSSTKTVWHDLRDISVIESVKNKRFWVSSKVPRPKMALKGKNGLCRTLWTRP